MPAKKAKKIKVQDLKPKKDAKGGFLNTPGHNNPGHNPPSHNPPRQLNPRQLSPRGS
jgi:hypothetical protein